jgi:hypothetical protein
LAPLVEAFVLSAAPARAFMLPVVLLTLKASVVNVDATSAAISITEIRVTLIIDDLLQILFCILSLPLFFKK